MSVAVSFRLPPRSARPRILAGLAVAAVVGWAIPAFVVADGADRHPEGSPERIVAENALRNAWIHADNPVQRLVYRTARVDEIRRVPYHCGAPAGDPGDEVRDFAASVTYHSWFGLPVARMINDCGGEGEFWSAGVRGMPGPRVADHPIVGTWEIASWACPAVCALSPDQARALLGRRVEYSARRAEWDDVSCGPVSYPTERVTAGAVEADHGFRPGALALPERMHAVEVRCDGEAWPWPGGTVLLTDAHQGFVVHEGVFLGIVRDGVLPPDAAPDPAEGCERIEVRAPTLIALLWLPEEGAEEVVTPPAGLEATVAAFRSSLAAARPRLEARGIRVAEYAGACLEVVAPDGMETVRLRSLTGGAGYLLRGLGVRGSVSGVQEPAALVDFATRTAG